MNLLLVGPSEIGPGGQLMLSGRRARHLLEVLQVRAGQQVRIGMLNATVGQGVVTQVGHDFVRLSCRLDQRVPQPNGDTLLMAMPRPKVLARCLEHAVALGFSRIAIFRCRRVVKSHLDSSVLEPAQLQARLQAGLEQSKRTLMPRVQVFPRFMPFVEDHLEAWATPRLRWVAEAGAAAFAAPLTPFVHPFTLVLGPEGGLSDHELGRLGAAGFSWLSVGPAPLRVEAALNYITGQLHALRATTQAQSALPAPASAAEASTHGSHHES